MSYISRAITDRVDEDGTVHGHYGDPVPVSEIADDYGRLTVAQFDAKYPGWHSDRAFMTALEDEFYRRNLEVGADREDGEA